MIESNTMASLPVSLPINGSNINPTLTVYNSATSYDPLNVYLNTTLTIQAGIITVDQQNSITVTLRDQSGNPLAGRAVQISINSASYANLTIGSNGQASFNWQPTSTGNYIVAAPYSATGSSDNDYEPFTADIVVTAPVLVRLFPTCRSRWVSPVSG
jgi:hypothetical protein